MENEENEEKNNLLQLNVYKTSFKKQDEQICLHLKNGMRKGKKED